MTNTTILQNKASYCQINRQFSMKLHTILLFVVLFVMSANAQKIAVTRFYLDEKDLTAQNRRTEVEDQNGDKCALIRVQTTQRGFSFDVGSMGIQKIEDNHVGEIWVWVPFGVRHISIRHPRLGSLSNYDFPISIEKARTYIMEITSDKVFVNYYDDNNKKNVLIKVASDNATLTLNGLKVKLNKNGYATQELSYGTYTYKVVADGYYSKEGQITVDESTDRFDIDDLKPIMGSLSVHTDPYNAEVFVDGNLIPQNTSLTPHPLQIGTHKLTVKKDGYKTEEANIDIKQNKTTDVSVSLSQTTTFHFSSEPTFATLYIDGEDFYTPCYVELKTGTYHVKVSKSGYKDYEKTIELNSSNPDIEITLNKILNYKNELYVEVSVRGGTFIAIGGVIGGYVHNFNIELSAFGGIGDSETIYWGKTDTKPQARLYHPKTNLCAKVGWGIPLGAKFRLTPQIGVNFLKIKEEKPSSSNVDLANNANVLSPNIGVRFSVAFFKHFGVSLSPEYAIAARKSNGYKELEAVSPKIRKWGRGFNAKLGITLKF